MIDIKRKSKATSLPNSESSNYAQRRKLFLVIFKAAKKKYGLSTKRLAGDGWNEDWQLLFATMMSAQTRDETTIPAAEKLFNSKNSIRKIASAPEHEILELIKKVNYNKTKARNIKAAAKSISEDFNGLVPKSIDELTALPGIGRKTANLFLGELHKMETICVDTHVHRISNVLKLVQTKNPSATEKELMKVAPKKYWNQINRIFVLWGKETPGKEPQKLLSKIGLDESIYNFK